MREFISMYLLYRRRNSAFYALRSAWNIAVRGLPF